MTHLIVNLKFNHALLQQFRAFLDEREAKLADELTLAVVPAPGDLGIIHLHGSGHMKLTQALQTLATRIREVRESNIPQDKGYAAIGIVNKALWTYVEVLDGAVNELIQQLQQVDIQTWNQTFFEVVLAFKELLIHRIEDAIWLYRRLEDLLLTYRAVCYKRKNFWIVFGRILSLFSNILDKTLLKHLMRSQKMLMMAYESFANNFEAYQTISLAVEEKAAKFKEFLIFQKLPTNSQNSLLALYRLLKIREDNTKQKKLSQAYINQSIKDLGKSSFFNGLFREFFKLLRNHFYEISLKWQANRDLGIKSTLDDLKRELTTLATMVSHYREFFISLHPNPYQRACWNLTQWLVGPEPRKTRDFLNLIYEIESLAKWIAKLEETTKNNQTENIDLKRHTIFKQIEEVLHEMGQPLLSRSSMQVRAERLINLIDEADEIGGSCGDVRAGLTNVFLRALRYDSKYQVLFDDAHFEELYALHMGFIGASLQPAHEQRLKLFKQVINHFEHWLKEQEMNRHIQEIELDEALLQEELQKFLAALQREETFSEQQKGEYLSMLLQYRYLFNRFYHVLRNFEADGKKIRHDFLFVDNYLEAMEKLLKQQTPLETLYKKIIIDPNQGFDQT